MLCEKCNKAEATVHITEMVGDAPVEMKKRNFCEACFSQSELAKTVHGMTPHAPKCENCGAPGLLDWAAGIWGPDGTKDEEVHFLCKQCQEEEGKGPDHTV